ncbi:cytochrome P450 [Coprinellus micaceus]|uniref:Cytochrome P450 n=1 Tax=Coprinellus micaceus TaxID=71717 RepID=A0A4Y7T6C1_COPMI|nr:cytochrome P450 [Coprinellus micaceus]
MLGDIVYLNALGIDILVVETVEKAVDLLEKRANNYSDRPALAVLDLTTSSEWNFSLIPYGLKWRKLRRTFHESYSPAVIEQYRPVMKEEVQRCLSKVKDNPDAALEPLRMFWGTLAMRTSYGFVDPERNESLAKYAERFSEGFGEAIKPANFLVNIFPSLRYVPDWFPGTGWKRHLKELATHCLALRFRWCAARLTNLQQDRRYRSMAATIVDNLPEENDPMRAEAESLGRDAAVMAYLGGADTTASATTALVLALAMNYDVQKKAHAELDAIIGIERLPEIEDLPTLPYVHAIVKEVNRWFTVLPMGVGHSSVEDDEYEGYFIPKGALVMPNAWAMMHNPDTFENPFEFKPERYLKDGQIDPTVPDAEQAAFGFGRRICPGRHFSHDALFLLAASLMHTFLVEPPKDDSGNIRPLALRISNHFVCKPLPFKCVVTLRPGREALVL